MTKMKYLFLGLGLALTVGACAPADPPADPSFQTDVLPLMQAHCVRCHGANNSLNKDPGSVPNTLAYSKGVGPVPPETGYFDHYEDRPGGMDGCPLPPMAKCAGAAGLAVSIKTYVHTALLQMPPLPAEPLSDWELKLIDNWVAKAPTPPPKP